MQKLATSDRCQGMVKLSSLNGSILLHDPSWCINAWYVVSEGFRSTKCQNSTSSTTEE